MSVVISTYERPALLRRALLSVLAQDYKDYEVLVVHDGPASGETEDVCRGAVGEFALIDVPLTFIASEENSGYQCVPKNVGIWSARGDYIAFLDDDNEWLPAHLSALVAAMEEGHDWPDFAYCRRRYVHDDGFVPPEGKYIPAGDSPYVPWCQESADQLQHGPMHNFIDSSDVLIAKGALWRAFMSTGQMWNESLRRFADWELMTRGVHFSGWRGRGVDEVLSVYHWHGENIQLTRPVNETPKQV